MRAESPMPRAHMDVTPMLDVLLVIIVVFLVVQMQSIWKSMYLQTPEPCRLACGEATSFVIQVGPPEQFAINGEEVPFARLAPRLSELFRGQRDRSVWVMGDSGVTYGRVMSVIDAARGAGANVIGVVPKDITPQ